MVLRFEDSKVIKLKVFGWCELAEELVNFLACEKQIETSKKISQLCKIVFTNASKRETSLDICQNDFCLWTVIERKVREYKRNMYIAILLISQYFLKKNDTPNDTKKVYVHMC